MAKSKLKEGISTVLFMFIVTLIFISVLAFIHLYTKDQVKMNEQLALKKAVILASGLELPEDLSQLENFYDQKIKEITNPSGIVYYEASDSGNLLSYVMIRDTAGLWGTITAAVGISPDFTSFTGIEFLKQDETPGLGARITESWFKKQFLGKSAPLTLIGEGEKGNSHEIQAITGATITTNAVKDMMNKILTDAAAIITRRP